jgi:hypothetical protein
MTEQEKDELQHLKERVAYLEGFIFALQSQKSIPYLTINPNQYWYGPYPKFEVTC